MTDAQPAAIISYSRVDSEFALRLADDLKAAGANVWIDQRDIKPGAPWDNAIEAALIAAPQMLVILSPTSVRSENVRDEIAYALRQGKIVIPVLYLDCDVPLRLGRKQHIDFRTDYARGLSTLLYHLRIERPNQSVLDKAAEDEAGRKAAWLARDAEARRLAEMREKERLEDARQKEDAELKAIDDAEQKAREESARKAGADAERKAAEEKAREDAARKAREDALRKAAEERKAREQKIPPAPKPVRPSWIPKLIRAICVLALLAFVIDLAYRHWFGHAGARWVVLNSGVNSDLDAMAGSSDGKIIYACGHSGVFLSSTNAGATWADRTSSSLSNCDSLFSTSDGKHVWAATNTSRIQASTDGGASWQPIQLPVPADTPAQSSSLADKILHPGSRTSPLALVPFPDSNSNPAPHTVAAIFGTPDGVHLWAIGNDGGVYQSDSYGGVWDSRVSNTPADLNAISGSSDGSILMAVGAGGITDESIDAGRGWWHYDTTSQFSLRSVFVAAEGRLICVVGDVSTVLITTDKGVTWTAGQKSADGSFHGIFGTADGKHLWAVATSGIIVQSDDSGVQWKLRDSGVKPNLNAIFGTPDGKYLWAVGDEGKIIESRNSWW